MEHVFIERKQKLEQFNELYRRRRLVMDKVNVPDGLFIKCDHCEKTVLKDRVIEHSYVCPECGYHLRIDARTRIKMLVDDISFVEFFATMPTANPLQFPNYEEKLTQARENTGENDAFICGTASMGKIKIAIGVLDSFFMMGSMGSVVGEKVTRIIEHATHEGLPLIIITASGGARMQEGIYSLMQMAKTSAAIAQLGKSGLLFISVLTHPTTGGVAASFASLGDIIIAEKGALIGFAGPRVIKQTIKEDLPEGFQTSEFQQEKGFVDLVVDRKQLKILLKQLLALHKAS